MTNDTPTRKPSWQAWVLPLVVCAGFVVFRMYRPGGAIADASTEASMTPAVARLGDRMLAALAPIGAAAICLKEAGADPALERAAIAFNRRNKTAMDSLVLEITAAGGMTNAQKDLLDRRGYQDARDLVGYGKDRDAACATLARRLDLGQWDLRAAPAD